ncbi:MAG TPA: RDD family protein [Pseudomonadales bacterium]
MNAEPRVATVTGVDVALRVAGPGARSYAFLIDWHLRLLLALAWVGVGLLLGRAGMPAPWQLTLFLLPSAAVYLLYHPVLELLMHGSTPGKRMAGVRIVMEDGSTPGAAAILIRNVLRVLDSLPAFYVVGLVSTLITRHSTRLGDLVAGTLLVYERPGAESADTFARDREAIARHGLENVELARELLERWKALEPQVRQRLAHRLLERLGDPVDGAADEIALRRRLEAQLGG